MNENEVYVDEGHMRIEYIHHAIECYIQTDGGEVSRKHS